MKIAGGYQPKIAGRPVRAVSGVPVPDVLHIDLKQFGYVFGPAVKDGEQVSFGMPLAWADVPGGRIALPSPASGRVVLEKGRKGNPGAYAVKVTDARVKSVFKGLPPEKVNAEDIRRKLAESGIWPFLTSSKSGAMPALDAPAPQRMIVSCVLAEPFRARGKTVLENDQGRFLAGLRYLSRLMSEGGLIHLVMTDLNDPVARAVCKEVSAQKGIMIETVPVRYPVEDSRVLCTALRRSGAVSGRDEEIWKLDAQAVCAIGACMAEGIPLHERIVAAGGPAMRGPRHLRVRIGTGLDRFIESDIAAEERMILCGGIMKGVPAEAVEAVRYDSDAFFVMPRSSGREFLGFVNPGFNRASILPCFVSWLTRAADSSISATLRGERRPCIACGLCEEVCPVNLMPQVLHRYLYRDALDEAERSGVKLCIGCGLCSYVCPSKIELRHQFEEAHERIRRERSAEESH